jgi:uncharacterized protein
VATRHELLYALSRLISARDVRKSLTRLQKPCYYRRFSREFSAVNTPAVNALVIDAFEFCRTNGSREGETPVAKLERLVRDCASPAGTLAWKVQGGNSKQGYPQLRLGVTGTVQLTCQRCLAPFAYEIDSSTALLLGENDANADEIEAIIDDESIDVIVGTRSMNLMDLIEDEALLALPQAPKHDVCPDTGLLDAVRSEKPSPFDALKALKN